MNSTMEKAIGATASGALCAHLVLTVIDNLPDQHISLRDVSARFTELPIWRFFGPNPGVDDMHLLYRYVDKGTPVSEWDEIDVRVDRPWWAPVWNPGTRGPKALFDATQHVKKIANARSGDFDSVVDSPGYRLLKDFVASAIEPRPDADSGQFLLLTTRPDPVSPQLQPVLTSEPFRL